MQRVAAAQHQSTRRPRPRGRWVEGGAGLPGERQRRMPTAQEAYGTRDRLRARRSAEKAVLRRAPNTSPGGGVVAEFARRCQCMRSTRGNEPSAGSPPPDDGSREWRTDLVAGVARLSPGTSSIVMKLSTGSMRLSPHSVSRETTRESVRDYPPKRIVSTENAASAALRRLGMRSECVPRDGVCGRFFHRVIHRLLRSAVDNSRRLCTVAVSRGGRSAVPFRDLPRPRMAGGANDAAGTGPGVPRRWPSKRLIRPPFHVKHGRGRSSPEPRAHLRGDTGRPAPIGFLRG